MNKICTTIEQSKKLIELGINISTADMYYSYDYNINEYEDDAQIIPQSELGQRFSLFPEDIPAWSLSTLLDIYPIVVGRDMDTYCCWYNKKNIQLRGYENPIDAVFEMIVKIEGMHSTMKQYTDIEQSTKLIELPIE